MVARATPPCRYPDRVTAADQTQGRTVVLVGMPGSGKSTVGEVFALRRGRPFIDLDDAIERTAGRSIEELFDQVGEAGFREVETVVLADTLTSEPDAVIAGGGGLVLSPDNRRLLASADVCTVWLRADADTLGRRVGNGHGRPLLEDDPVGAINRLLVERQALYRQVADLIVDVDALPAQAVVDRLCDELAGTHP